MVAQQDCSIGFGVESTYKTGVTPTVWPEFVSDSLDWNKNIRQSAGLKVGSYVSRSRRRVVPTASGGGDITVEAQSKGLGKIWRAALGSGSSTVVSGSTYQQVFTFGNSPSPLTIERGLPMADGSLEVTRFLGSVVTGWEFACPNGDIATLRTSWDSGDIDTATGYTAPSYVSGSNVYHFGGGKLFTGTLTAPTSTALASATSPVAGIRSCSVTVNNNPDVGRFNLNATGRKDVPLSGVREIAVSLDVELQNTTFRDAMIADTEMVALLHFETPATLSTGVETLQIVVPGLKFDTALPQSNAGSLIIQSLTGAGLDNETAGQAIWVVQRTADTAI